MSLTLIAVTGFIMGLLCLAIGFFMEDAHERGDPGVIKIRRGKLLKKKVIVPKRKAA